MNFELESVGNEFIGKSFEKGAVRNRGQSI
jgi:hypothetical protein